MVLLLFKLFTTPALILAATLVSRRFGQATGGWLVGLPLTSGPIAVFLAIEHGPEFAQHAASGSLAGTTAQVCFAVVFAQLAAQRSWSTCLLGGIVVFIVAGLLLTQLALSALVLFVVATASLVAGLASIQVPAALRAEGDAPRWDLPVRIAVATSLVLLVTAVAHLIGPDLSGLAAAFPLFAQVLGVFAHRHHGSAAAQSVMRGLLFGLFGFVGFFATVSLLVTRTGLAGTFVAALAVNLGIHGAALLALRRTGHASGPP